MLAFVHGEPAPSHILGRLNVFSACPQKSIRFYIFCRNPTLLQLSGKNGDKTYLLFLNGFLYNITKAVLLSTVFLCYIPRLHTFYKTVRNSPESPLLFDLVFS